MNIIQRVTIEEIKFWQLRIAESRPSVVFREMAAKYDIGLADLSALLSSVYIGVESKHVYAIWKWDIHEKGRGLNDQQIDQLFMELDFRKKWNLHKPAGCQQEI